MRGGGGLLDSLPEAGASGAAIYDLAAALYPLNRSLTGDGVRETLRLLQTVAPFEIKDVPSGTRVLDWHVPPEWNVRAAHITDTSGRRIVDLADHTLHVVGYSTPVDRTMTLAELRPHLHTLPDRPELIPYRTSYYRETWGFCLTQRQLEEMPDTSYRVLIDSTLNPAGSLTYGELFIPGESDDEVLLSTHVCHPSLANDNCSGLALLAWLARLISGQRMRLGYRLLLIPGTIGSIAWLARNRETIGNIRHGLVVSNVGDGGGPTYKRSRRGNAPIDRAASLVLQATDGTPRLLDFSPYGYDERQYCSPGFDLAVGSFQRSRWGEYPAYHTSADNLDLIRPEHLERSLRLIAGMLDVVDADVVWQNTMPYGEPQLGRRGLYDDADGRPLPEAVRMAILWVLNLADARHSVIDMVERSGLPFASVKAAIERLRTAGLLVPAPPR
jgi:aminopeptidase-like protein